MHCFDLFAGWLGSGIVESAGRVMRPGSRIEEQVYCTARYGDVPVTFYHGFTQAGRMDRQELRLLQLTFIADPWHPRVITEDNGRESLRMSVRATELATSS